MPLAAHAFASLVGSVLRRRDTATTRRGTSPMGARAPSPYEISTGLREPDDLRAPGHRTGSQPLVGEVVERHVRRGAQLRDRVLERVDEPRVRGEDERSTRQAGARQRHGVDVLAVDDVDVARQPGGVVVHLEAVLAEPRGHATAPRREEGHLVAQAPELRRDGLEVALAPGPCVEGVVGHQDLHVGPVPTRPPQRVHPHRMSGRRRPSPAGVPPPRPENLQPSSAAPRPGTDRAEEG